MPRSDRWRWKCRTCTDREGGSPTEEERTAALAAHVTEFHLGAHTRVDRLGRTAYLEVDDG